MRGDHPHRCADEPGTVVLDVAALSHGPDGVARLEGRAVFVPRVAPGDRVRARLVETRPSYARAEVVHRCAAGSAWREPPCPWIGECGGCPWQQVAYATQVEAKARNVREALARIGRVTARRELPALAAPDEWHYRQRIRLHCDEARRLGYLQPRSHRVVEIDACLIADPLLSTALAPVRDLVAALATTLNTVEIATNGRGAVVLHARTRDRWQAADAATIKGFLATTPAVAGVALAGRAWQERFGDPTLTVTPDATGPPIVQPSGSFTQVNPGANRLLVATVVAMAAPTTRVLDLFCGAGNLALPLARAGARVIGVDRDREAIAAAAASAAAAGLAGLRFHAAPAERFLRQQGTAGADLVVLDPPRTGAAATVAQLTRLAPARILYVSCDPATLARDVAVLAGSGYAVDRVQPIDLFPQTEHVETVLEAVRAGAVSGN